MKISNASFGVWLALLGLTLASAMLVALPPIHHVRDDVIPVSQ